MSKLRMIAVSTFVVLTLVTVGFLSKNIPKAVSEHFSSRDLSQLNETDAKNIWGKSRGPVLVKIEELQRDRKIIHLKGLIRSQFPSLEIEWKLPAGAILLEGSLYSSAQKNSANEYDDQFLKVDLSGAKDEPIIFIAFSEKNNERIGHSRVYKWNPTTAEVQQLEKIKTHMKARKKMRLVR